MMKTILFSVLFSGALGAPCADGEVDGIQTVAAACECGTVTDCATACLKGANNAYHCAAAADIAAIAVCDPVDGSAAVTATCACNAAADIVSPATATSLAKYHLCVKDETCNTGETTRCAAPKSDDTATDSDATMIGSFAAVMTTTMLSF